MAGRHSDDPGTSVTDTTTTTTRTAQGHVWERSRRGVVWPVAAGLVGLAALGAAQFLPVRDAVENDLTERSSSALGEAGLSGVDVSFDGRDGVVTGRVASEDERRRVLALVEEQQGVRVAVDRLTVGAPTATPTPTPTATPTPTPTPTLTPTPTPTLTPTPTPTPTPTAAGDASATVTVGGGAVTLTGAVPDDATKGALVAAAADLVGADKVDDRLTVDAAAPGDGLAALAGVLTGLGKDADATVTLDGGTISLDGTVATQDARTAALTAAETVVGDAAAVRDGLTVAAPGDGDPAADDAAAAAAELAALPRITFRTGSATLTADGRRTVREAARILREYDGVKVEIQGHTDSFGTRRVNRELSAARARTVLVTLRGNGVARDRMTSKGYGETRPEFSNSTPENRAKNRRVVFQVVGA